jgi:hypothetical protein
VGTLVRHCFSPPSSVTRRGSSWPLDWAVNRSIAVFALFGFLIAAEMNRDKPSAVASCDDLAPTTRIQNLTNSLGYVDPTHLPIFLTNDVVNFIGTNPGNCCVIGFHGAGPVPSHTSNGPMNGNGDQPVQTWAWASWTSPGFFARANGGTAWALQDIHALSHEISEWADDPFINNFVEPWSIPVVPGAPCSNVLETGDPVVAIGFAKGTNTFEQGPNPNGTQSADGFYHPEDEVHLPWFMQLAPNLVSEPTQTATTNIGRYTFMGTLNPFAAFTHPATCP